jgi:hypothetical protein
MFEVIARETSEAINSVRTEIASKNASRAMESGNAQVQLPALFAPAIPSN